MNIICRFCHKECKQDWSDSAPYCNNHPSKVKYVKNRNFLDYNNYTVILKSIYKNTQYYIFIYEDKISIYKEMYYESLSINYTPNLTPENIDNKLSTLLCFS